MRGLVIGVIVVALSTNGYCMQRAMPDFFKELCEVFGTSVESQKNFTANLKQTIFERVTQALGGDAATTDFFDSFNYVGLWEVAEWKDAMQQITKIKTILEIQSEPKNKLGRMAKKLLKEFIELTDKLLQYKPKNFDIQDDEPVEVVVGPHQDLVILVSPKDQDDWESVEKEEKQHN